MTYSTMTTTANQYGTSETTHSCVMTPDSRSLTFDYPLGSLESFTDVVIPNYHARSAKGEIFNNPMSSSKIERSVEMGTFVGGWHYKVGDLPGHRHCPEWYRENVPGAPGALNAHGVQVGHLGHDINVQNLIDDAGTQAYAAIDNPTFDGGVFIAELRETISFLRNPLRAFNDALRESRIRKNRNRFGRSKILGSFLRDNWLSYRYGFRPIVKDIEDAAVAVAQTVLNEKPKRKTARGTSSDNQRQASSGVCPNDSRYDYQMETSTAIEVRAGVLYEFFRSPDTFGTDWVRAPVAAWEAIPYSFVIDRFFNVGSFVEAIVPKAGIRHLSAWTTVTRTQETQRSTRMVNLPDSDGRVSFIESDGLTTERFRSVTKTRTPGVRLGLAMKPDPFGLRDNDLEVAFITDLVALGSQLLRSK